MLLLVPLMGCAAGACWLAFHARAGATCAVAIVVALLLRVAGGFSARDAWRALRSRDPRHRLVYVPIRLAGAAWLLAGVVSVRSAWSVGVLTAALACVVTCSLHFTFVAKEDGWDFTE